MSKEQRTRVDALLRRPRPTGPRTVAKLRAGFAALMSTVPVPTGIHTRRTVLGDRPALVVETDGTERPGTILYFHGGGWVMGSPEEVLSVTAALVVRTGMRAWSVDYRLAPEHPFPAAIEDTLAAYRALLDKGIESESIVFAGDSAGGGLAVATTLAARDAGLPLPAAVVTFSPGLDLTRTGASMTTKADADPIFTRASVEHTGAMYLAGQDPKQPLLSPAVCADLTGFPPLLLQSGTNELLLDDSVRLADRARDAGVDVTLDVTADVPHVFQIFAGTLDAADEALDRAALFARQHIRQRAAQPVHRTVATDCGRPLASVPSETHSPHSARAS